MSKVNEFSLEEEYKKPHGIKPEDVRVLREWIQTQPHLPAKYITDLDIILVYNSCDCSTEITKQVLDTQFTLKTVLTDFFKDRAVDQDVEQSLDSVLMTMLPTPTKEGYKVLYSHHTLEDSDHYDIVQQIRTMLMVIELWQYEEGTWPGLVIISNTQGFGLKHMAKIEMTVLQKFYYYLQEALPVKLKGLHVLNSPSFGERVLRMTKHLIKSPVIDLMYLHPSGADSIEQYYPVTELPREAGGQYKSVSQLKAEVLQKLKANSEFFIQENRKRVDEKLRPGAPKTAQHFFGGVEGTFKQLEFD